MRACENEDCVKMRLLRKWEVVKMRYYYRKGLAIALKSITNSGYDVDLFSLKPY